MTLIRSISFRRAAAPLAVLAALGAMAAFASFASPGATKQCRVLFGPDAATEVILELDDENLWLYRDGLAGGTPERFALDNGRLLEDAKIEIRGANDSTRYTVTSLARYQDEEPQPRDYLMIFMDVDDGERSYKQYCDVELRPAGEVSAIAHFNGPLTIQAQTVFWELPEWMKLVHGKDDNDLRAVIGTLSSERRCWTMLEVHDGDLSNFPAGVFPYVDIEFPSKTPGEPGPKQRYPLDQFC